MIKMLRFFLVAGIFVFVSIQVANIEGQVVIEWQNWRMISSAALLLTMIVIFALISVLFYRVWRGLVSTPSTIIDLHKKARVKRGYRALTRGMVAVAAGDSKEAQRQVRRTGVLLDDPPLTLLLSAQTAQLNGDQGAAKQYFQMMLERKETSFLGLRGLLIQAEREGNRPEAIKLAERAFRLQPKTAWILNTLYDLYVADRQWHSAGFVLEKMAKANSINKKIVKRRRAALALLTASNAVAQINTKEASIATNKAYRLAPDWLPAIIAKVAVFEKEGKTGKAATLIEKKWPTHPHPKLAEIYGRVLPEGSLVEKVLRFEKLGTYNPNHTQTLLSLANVMIEAGLWGSARSKLKLCLQDGETVEVCRLFALLEEQEKKDVAAANQWLRRAEEAVSGPGWYCNECNRNFGVFSPDCVSCGALGTIDWGTQENSQIVEKRFAISKFKNDFVDEESSKIKNTSFFEA